MHKLMFVLLMAVATPFTTDVVAKLIQKWDSDPSRYRLILDNSTEERYSYEAINGTLTIWANRPGNLARGFKKYIQKYCNASIFWFNTKIKLPSRLPDTNGKETASATAEWRYFLNFCTHGYTYAFYNFSEWEAEIDLMAMHGVSHVLVIQGHNKLWQNILRRLSFNESDINDYLVGPGFEPWWLLSNLYGYGGPISQAFIDTGADIQQRIVARLREYGIVPVGPLFYASVPPSMKKYYPDEDITDTGKWITYNRPAILNPSTPFFRKVAAIYYE